MDFVDGADTRNRALLKFSGNSSIWYVNLYTQSEDRQTTLASTSSTVSGTTTVTVASTAGLEVGMVVTGAGIAADGTATIVKILDATRFVLSPVKGAAIADGTNSLTYTVQEDGLAPIDTTATVGSRLDPPAGHEAAGYITAGSNYYPAAYLNPFTVGVAAAGKGAIIPVNARPSDNILRVRWFKKIPAQSADFQDLHIPGKMGRYTVGFPQPERPEIIIAQGVGTDDLPPAEAAGSVYVQNASGEPGFNPNEEHAFMIGGRAYALRDDLNVISGNGYSSHPFVLVAYTDPKDERPAMHAYKVARVFDRNGNGVEDKADGDILFDYESTAGTLLVKPYPLPLMPPPLVGTGVNRRAKDIEITGANPPLNGQLTSDPAYQSFTFQDRKGFTWVHRGAHDGSQGALSMKLYYPGRAGFFVPGMGEIPAGTILPFLRNAARSGLPLDLNAINDGQSDQPLLITYRPTWPANAPELRVGETLTLPKFGLPQVRGQTSAQVLYQQSLAKAATVTALGKNSVTLYDPTREKTVALDAAGVGLTALPAAILTSSYQGKTYFQGLPPHLQKRFFLDPPRGAKGTLVLQGVFHDEAAGEDYLDLNLLTIREVALLKNLVPTGGADKSKWEAAIDALNTRVETFKSNPAQFGSYIVDSSKTWSAWAWAQSPEQTDLATVTKPDTAVDSYAITATGQGTGFVTMVFGNGHAFTPEGDPVQVQVFKVADQLYVGDLKVVLSSNPLDEQVTLRHSGDFAGKPEKYEFQWRWATGEASAPATYSSVMETRVGDPVAGTDKWRIVRNPKALQATADRLAAAGNVLPLPRSEDVRPLNYLRDAQGNVTATVDETSSLTEADTAAGYPALYLQSASGVDFTPAADGSGGVPGSIVFSASLGDLDGLVLYVNGRAALAYNAAGQPLALTNASGGLSREGLEKQFSIAPSFFTAAHNTVAVAVYSGADPNTESTLNFRLEAARESDLVAAAGSDWQDPVDSARVNTNTAIVGGSPSNPFGGPQFVLNDRWFTMRYRPLASANNVLGTPWSRWMPPQFVEGWVKRVLAAINPFEQRVKDLYNNQTDSTVSVLTQAGTRWEGNIALTLDNIADTGLIPIYETVLNRARSMSIDANTNDPDSNNALLLASGYLNDLYTILGNEAYADAANPTISLDDASTSTEVNTSRFSYEGQVSSSLDEEMALLRGRDDFVSPGVMTAPVYNRLFWNYTHGINSGEVLYAVNYNIREQAGGATADGVVDEADAQRMFPQGHGDAYGHYLTALTDYYRLLTNDNFTWTPRAEAVTVLGQPVTVDFMDERKFAAAAANVARTAEQVIALTYRKNYKDDPAAGWSHYRDRKGTNTSTGETSHQGLDEWVSRGTQGAYLHWVVGNAMLPATDNYHSGVQKIDRTTVPELAELPSEAVAFQTSIDNANAHLNPLGLSPDAIAFDLSPTELKAGTSHFEQVYNRALRALNNAAGAFDQAAVMTRSLRNQQNTVDDYSAALVQQELAYTSQLIDLFGRPYSGEVGPGKTYSQAYTGPDLEHWYVVDRPFSDTPSLITDTTSPLTATVRILKSTARDDFTKDTVLSIMLEHAIQTSLVSVTIYPNQFVQYSDIFLPGMGSRPETGELQAALLDAHLAYMDLQDAISAGSALDYQFQREGFLMLETISAHAKQLDDEKTTGIRLRAIETVQKTLETASQLAGIIADTADETGDAIAEFFPRIVGVANDVTAPLRGSAKVTAFITSNGFALTQLAADTASRALDVTASQLEQDLSLRLEELGYTQEERQMAYEFEQLYGEVTSQASNIARPALAYQRATEQVRNVIAKGNRLLAEREVFRQRAASVIQGYRTKDVAFRLFRDESLEQYRSLYDLASRYTYLAAKSYDYETGLLGTSRGQDVFNSIVASRALGDLTGGVPQSTASTLGDAGLAGSMARLNADFSVAKGRLGINNPDQNGTVFSLRQELFRIQDDDNRTDDEQAWQQTLEQHIVSDLMNDPDAATFCRNLKKSDGSPVPGIVIPFSSTIQSGRNFFGLPLAGGDHNFTASNYATKIYSAGMVLKGYTGMDPYVQGTPNAGAPASGSPDALGATPYLYLIPTGTDSMLAPPLGDTGVIRTWNVHDQALPLPFNLGASDFNGVQFFNANSSLSGQPWILRKHQAFRAVSDPAFFYSTVPTEFTSSRLIGRSVWNSGWKIIIPAYSLLNSEQEGLNRFVRSVKDIQLFLRTYSHSGN
ncbi:MAG: hypothetical protein V4726_25150 [Verrucomicrobiota bacterium]